MTPENENEPGINDRREKNVQPNGKPWLIRSVLELLDGSFLEVVSSPDEAIVIPFTADGRILLVQRHASALEKSIITGLSAANPNKHSPKSVAVQAFHKLNFPGDENAEPTDVGNTNAWKYLTSTTHIHSVDLRLKSSELLNTTTIVDDKTENYLTFSEEEFFSAIDSGTITDLRAIVAVQLALAKKHGQHPDVSFPGDPALLNLLVPTQIRDRRDTTEHLGKDDWFPRVNKHGDETIQNSSNQVQVIGVIKNQDGPQSIVFLAEPYFAQGRVSLALPSGAVEKGYTDTETTVREMREETGFELKDGSSRRITPPRHPMPLYFTVTSSVFEAEVARKGVPEGGDESEAERGRAVVIPVDQISWLIHNGHITDMSVIAGLLDWGRKHQIQIL